tara:strand:- start:216 stop:1370 length:1155 start_codon:yes stop_codon:yes gene_type:complete
MRNKKIYYNKQFIDKDDRLSVSKVLSQNLITTGPSVVKFENMIKKYVNSKFSHSCSSGTSAIHLAMISLGIQKGDIILMPAVNFIASYNMARSLNAKIFLVDVDEKTGQITPELVLKCISKNKLKKIKVLVTMYHGGYPENVEAFYRLKKVFKFLILEDACHAFGASYLHKGKYYKIGSCKHADVCTFSFHPVKSITTGEGGMVTTNQLKISKKIRLYRNHGIERSNKYYWKYNIKNIGYNYRLSDLNCSLGTSQLKKINFLINSRKKIYNLYVKKLSDINPNLYVHQFQKKIKSSFHLFLININFKNINKTKDHFIKFLNAEGIYPQFHYIPIYKFQVYKQKKIYFSGAENYFKNTVSLPIFVDLNKSSQNKIIKSIKKYFDK